MPCFSVVPPTTPVDPTASATPSLPPAPTTSTTTSRTSSSSSKNPYYPGSPYEAAARGRRARDGEPEPRPGGRTGREGQGGLRADEGVPASAAFAPGGEYDRRFGGGRAPARSRAGRCGPAPALHTTRGPFASLRLRRAAALALDRARSQRCMRPSRTPSSCRRASRGTGRPLQRRPARGAGAGAVGGAPCTRTSSPTRRTRATRRSRPRSSAISPASG